MPPDYPLKKENDEFNKDTPNRLGHLEEKLYANNQSEASSSTRTSFNSRNTIPLRREWDEESLPKEHRPEPVSTRNTFAFLKQILIGSIILFIVSVGIAAYVFLGGKNVVSTKNVIININTSTTVSGGENLPIEIGINNQNNVPLISADLLLEYSNGGRNPENLTEELKRYREDLGSIDVGEAINKKYNVVFFGEEGESKDIKVSIEYRVQGSNAIFSKSETRTVKLSSAPVSVSVLSPSEVSAGEEINFAVTVGANSSEVVGSLALLADYPFGFQATESDPRPTYSNNFWNLGDLKPGSTRTIKIKGQLAGEQGEERVVRFSIGTADSKDQRKMGVVFLSKTQTIAISKPPIELNLALGGSNDPEYITDAGASIRSDVILRNNLDSKITDVTVEVKLNGQILDRNSVNANLGFYRSIDNTIVWNQSAYKDLAVMEPGDEVDLSFSFNTLKSASTLKSPSMTVQAIITGNRLNADSGVEKISLLSTKTIKIASQLGISARILYSDGPFLNSGPVPPKVEQETTYTVALSVTNSSNDLSDVTVNTSLPIYTKWLGKTSPEGENIQYNPVGGGIIWNVGEIKAGTPREAYFQISFVPSLAQLKQYPVLLNNVSATGYDRFSALNLNASQYNLLDISMPDDSLYQSRGGPVGQ
ncbi:MAG TPA: hypothetical protein VJI33_02140 [Candidatus Paceibacterota bacterium]